MGGVPHAKVPSNDERNASMLAAKKSSTDFRALAEQQAFLKRRNRRSSAFGGPETGVGGLGAAATTLGVGGV